MIRRISNLVFSCRIGCPSVYPFVTSCVGATTSCMTPLKDGMMRRSECVCFEKFITDVPLDFEF
jgi:hypothetical protein